MSDDQQTLDAIFAKPGPWQAEMNALRAIMRDCPVVEELKWHQPCYSYHGSNLVIIGAFKEFCTLSFFKGVLLSDRAGILVAPGENSRSARIAKFTDLVEIQKQAATLKAYVHEAVEMEKAGTKVDLPPDDFALPAELLDKMASDPALAAAFHALTPGRQRGWCLYFSQPKQSATRAGRIDKATPQILSGKGMHDR